MRLSHVWIGCVALALLASCDKEEAVVATSSTPQAAAARAEPAQVEAPAKPADDDAPDVEIDKITGWPEVIAEPNVAESAPESTDVQEELTQERVAIELEQRLAEAKPQRAMKQRLRKKLASRPMQDGAGKEDVVPLLLPAIDEHIEGNIEDLADHHRKSEKKLLREKKRPRTKGNAKPIFEEKPADQAVPPMHAQTGRQSTFAVDVDTGSYALAKGRMRRGYPPKPEQIRTEEWLNAFAYEHHVDEGQTFAVHAEMAKLPLSEEAYLRVHVAGESVADDERPPAHLTFVVDVSGSMFGPDKLDLIKESLTYLVDQLRPDDTIALVTYANKTEVALWPTSATKKETIRQAIASIEPGGSTAMDDGLKLGYAIAFRESHYSPGDIHRVVLLGDGRANVGARNPESLLGPISNAVEKGVTLSTIGFGAEEFNDQLLEQLANRGNGNYSFIDSFKDARRVFGEQLCGTLHVIGYDAKIQVEFGDRVRSWKLLGYENRKLENHEFRNDAVDAGEIGAGHQVTAIYRVELKDGDGPVATARLRWKPALDSKAQEIETQVSELTPGVETSGDFRFAVAVAESAERLKHPKELGLSMNKISQLAEEGVSKEWPARVEFLGYLRELEPFFK